MAERIPYFTIDTPYDIAYRKDAPAYPVGPHTHNAAELYLTLTNLPDVLLGDKVSEVSAGSLIVIPPFCIHQLYHASHVIYERYILSINPEWLAQVFSSDSYVFPYLNCGTAPSIISLSKEELTQLLALLTPFLTDTFEKSTQKMLAFFTLLHFLDAPLSTAYRQQYEHTLSVSPSQQRINEMISYLNEHLTEPLQIKDMARHFFMNPDYLSRLFKAHTHVTISNYVTLRKINQAQLLMQKGHSITEIQELLGYSSYAHFVKTFKKITGITPGQYKLLYK